jgi:CheY-like chemotaxis protein
MPRRKSNSSILSIKHPAETNDFKKAPIVFVDDEFLARHIFQNYYEQKGYKVICFENGKIALKYLLKHPDVKVVITDLRMREGEGEYLVNAIHRNNIQVGIFILTAYGTPEIQQDLLLKGIHGFIDKKKIGDVNKGLEELHQLIQKYLQLQGVPIYYYDEEPRPVEKGGKIYGPYQYRRWKDYDGKLVGICLGKEGEEEEIELMEEEIVKDN